jgi:hypothetical protein
MPELGDGATGVVELRKDTAGIGIGRGFVQHAGITPSDRYLASAHTRLGRKVSVDKAAQGRKGSWDPDRTVLLADIFTVHLGQDGLAAWLDGVPVEWEDLPFAAVAVCFSNLQGPFLWGSCRYWPDLDPADRAHPGTRPVRARPARHAAHAIAPYPRAQRWWVNPRSAPSPQNAGTPRILRPSRAGRRRIGAPGGAVRTRMPPPVPGRVWPPWRRLPVVRAARPLSRAEYWQARARIYLGCTGGGPLIDLAIGFVIAASEADLARVCPVRLAGHDPGTMHSRGCADRVRWTGRASRPRDQLTDGPTAFGTPTCGYRAA